MNLIKFIAINSHISEFPDPITFSRGDILVVGEEYKGDEGWEGWVFCTKECHDGGWVPRQFINVYDSGKGVAKINYTARELNINEGDVVFGGKVVNGWVWCVRVSDQSSGWVPLNLLKRI